MPSFRRLENSSRSNTRAKRVLGTQLHDVLILQRLEPLAVEPDFRFRRIENLEYLRLIGLGVLVDLVARHRRPGNVAAGRVADQAGHVADQKDDLMPEILEVLQLADQDRVPEMQVGGGGVEARLHADRPALFGTMRSGARAGLLRE